MRTRPNTGALSAVDGTTQKREPHAKAAEALCVRRLVLVYVESQPDAVGRAWPITDAELTLRRAG